MLDILVTYLLLCGLYFRVDAVSPTELFCVDPNCSTPFSSGVVIRDINTDKGLLLKKDSTVDIVGKSVPNGASILRVKVNNTFVILESSFVKELQEPDVRNLQKYSFSASETIVSQNTTPSSTPTLQTSDIPKPDSNTGGAASTAKINSKHLPSEKSPASTDFKTQRTETIEFHKSMTKRDDQEKSSFSPPGKRSEDEANHQHEKPDDKIEMSDRVDQHEGSSVSQVQEETVDEVPSSSSSKTVREKEELNARQKVESTTEPLSAAPTESFKPGDNQAKSFESSKPTDLSLENPESIKVPEALKLKSTVPAPQAATEDSPLLLTADTNGVRSETSNQHSDFLASSDSPPTLNSDSAKKEDVLKPESVDVGKAPRSEGIFTDTHDRLLPDKEKTLSTLPKQSENESLHPEDLDNEPHVFVDMSEDSGDSVEVVGTSDQLDIQTSTGKAESTSTSDQLELKDIPLNPQVMSSANRVDDSKNEREITEHPPTSTSDSTFTSPDAQNAATLNETEHSLKVPPSSSTTQTPTAQKESMQLKGTVDSSSANTTTPTSNPMENSDMRSQKTSSPEVVNHTDATISNAREEVDQEVSSTQPIPVTTNMSHPSSSSSSEEDEKVELTGTVDTSIVDSNVTSSTSSSSDNDTSVASEAKPIADIDSVSESQTTSNPASDIIPEKDDSPSPPVTPETPHQLQSDKMDLNSPAVADLSEPSTDNQSNSVETPDIEVTLATKGVDTLGDSQFIITDTKKPNSPVDPNYVNPNTDNVTAQPTEVSQTLHTETEIHIPYFQPTTNFPSQISLIQCIAWAANKTVNSGTSKALPASPLARLVIYGVNYFFRAADIILLRMPTGWRLSIDSTLTGLLDLPLSVLMAWVVFILHLLIGWLTSKLFWCLVFKHSGFRNLGSLSPFEYLQVEERALQLASRLSDQEETNSQLANWAAQMTLDLQQAQQERSMTVESLNERIQVSEAELEVVRNKLTESLEKLTKLDETYKSKLFESEQSVNSLRSELSTLTEEKLASEESWQSKLATLEASNQKAIEEAKREHEELYYQALDYYGRMKAMRPEMDKLLEARRQAEDRLAATEAELESLRTTFTTLKSFELALEQEHLNEENQENHVSPESSEYTMIHPPRDQEESDDVCLDNDEQKTPDKEENLLKGTGEVVEPEPDQAKPEKINSKVRANLALFLDIGRLQAQLDLATSQLKSEQAKSLCERQLREELESKVESMERETAELREKYDLIQEDRNTIQTKMEVLSAYFKERELELQRDLGKHVVVGSESSEALNACRKRNKELEAEVRALRDQVATLRRELAETERLGRRQVAELDKRSHENWLSARAADHQVQELRDENASLRQKLIEAERSALPPALRAQLMAPARPFLAGPTSLRPNVPLPSPSNPVPLDKRSISGQSLTSLSSQPSLIRTDIPGLPFPPPPPLPMAFPLPHSTSSEGGPQIPPPPPPPPFMLQGQLPFPHGFPPPPLPGAFPAQTNANALTRQSPTSSASGSVTNRQTIQ